MNGAGQRLLGAIEAGGTKWVCAVGSEEAGVVEEVVLPTRDPSVMWPAVLAVFDDLEARHGRIAGMGVGTFGPVGVRREEADYGVILNSPKVAWRGFDYGSSLRRHFGRGFPLVVETDVNAAAFAEGVEGETLIYVTVGTGIGGGVIQDGRIWHGRVHPEIGHFLVPESPKDPVSGFSCCPFHAGCVEGKASGTAMAQRWGVAVSEWAADHPGWDLEADYLASLAVSLTAGFSPDRIVWGGGVMKFEPLLSMVREKFSALSGGYWELPEVESYLVKSSLNDRAGLMGAFGLIGREFES